MKTAAKTGAKGRLVYIMENLFETDTKNKNIVFFCNYLKKNGIAVRFLTTINGQNRKIIYFGDKIPVIKFPSKFVIKQKPLFFPLKYLLKNRHNYDMLWCYLNRPSSFYAALMKILFGKKLIIKCDSVIPLKSENPFKNLWRYLSVNLPLKKADFIIAESQRVINAVSPLNKRIALLPNSIPLDDFKKLYKELKSVKKENIILSIGRIEPIKGTIDLIDAFSSFYAKNKNWKLIIVGPLTNEEYAKSLNRRVSNLFGKENPPVKLTGPKFGKDLYAMMKKSKIFCIASHEGGDGLSNVLPQAIYFGCYPLVTAVGDLNSQIKGLPAKPVPPQSPGELAKALLFAKSNLIDKKTLREHVEKYFTWKKNLPKLNKIFKKNG